jgi:peptidyl-tRNA hydrolase, PTH1 family
MEPMHLIVGLGNPGPEYVHTRHNAGFMVVERLATRWRAAWKNEARFKARVARAEVAGHKVTLCEPGTFMNLSGEAVRALTAYYQIAQNRILVLVDDADLAVGVLRLRPGGSSGGHHGLDSVEQHLGGREYARLKLGIGRSGTAERQIRNHVLGRFDAAESERFEKVLERAACQAECWLLNGIQRAMNEFNGTIETAGTKER